MSQTEKFFTQLLENSPLIIAVFDKKGCTVVCSNAFLRFVQAKTMEEIAGLPFAEIYRRLGDENLTGESLQTFQNIQESCSSRIEYRQATLYNADDGGYHSFTIETTPILDKNGQFDGVIVCFHDTAADVLQESEKVASMLFDATPMLCSFWGADGKMFHCNLEALRLLGVEKRSDYAERFYELNPEFQPDGESTLDKVKRYIADTFEHGTQRFEWMYKTASGEPLPVETTLIRLPWKDGYRLAAFSRDLREEKAQKQKITQADNLNRQLDIEKKAAQRAVQMRNEFLANLSHEFLTPMNAIQGFLNLVLMSPLSSQQRQWLKRTEEAAKSLLSVINNVLEISSLESGKLKFVSRFFCLDDILQNINKEFLPQAQTKELFFEIKYPPNIPNQLIGDAARLEQVLSHLLSNAFKFTPSGSVILDIQIPPTPRADGDAAAPIPSDTVMLQFAVRDTGIGMTFEEQDRLFHSYTQADVSTTREYSGTGVGLAICKGILELMNGKIWCESTPQQGSIFYATACFEVGKR